MEGMQFALEVYQTAWSCFGSVSLELSRSAESGEHTEDDKLEDGDDFFESSIVLAKRLLFLAYCELDGGQVASARQRLHRHLLSTAPLNVSIAMSGWCAHLPNLFAGDSKATRRSFKYPQSLLDALSVCWTCQQEPPRKKVRKVLVSCGEFVFSGSL